MKNSYFQYLHMRNLAKFSQFLFCWLPWQRCMQNKILTKLMLLLGGHNHCVKVSSDSKTVRGMGLWEFSGALRELMLRIKCISFQLAVLVLQKLMYQIIHDLISRLDIREIKIHLKPPHSHPPAVNARNRWKTNNSSVQFKKIIKHDKKWDIAWSTCLVYL